MINIFKIEIPEKRNFGLDLLRFIAIFTVLISHSITVLPDNFHSIVHRFITDGVLIFFVLSGFLIGRILIRDFAEGISIKKIFHFWKRRWFRTLPAFYFTILLLLIFGYLFKTLPDFHNVIGTSLFVKNLTFHNASFFPESWSLAIEEWFYLIFPILIFILYRLPIKLSALIACAFIIIFSFTIRLINFHLQPPTDINTWDLSFRSPVLARLDSISFGVLLAWVYSYKKNIFQKFKNISFVLGLFIFAFQKVFTDYFFVDQYLYSSLFYLSLMPISIMLMIPKIYYFRTPKNVYLTNIITIGSLISYSMYLVNLSLIAYLILPQFDISMWFKFALFWILTISSSMMIYKCVEVPFMKMRT